MKKTDMADGYYIPGPSTASVLDDGVTCSPSGPDVDIDGGGLARDFIQCIDREHNEKLKREARNVALREVLELTEGLKLRYAIFGRPDDGQLDRAFGEIKAKIEVMIKGTT